MDAKKYYTTGEAADLLNISRSTISRKFDRGVLFGKKNPITGERMISRESIATLMQQFNLPGEALVIEKKRILVGTSDERLVTLMQKIFSEDERVQMDRVEYGGDVLVACSRERPDLLVIDEELPDIACAEVIRSLRRMEEHQGLKIVCYARGRNLKRSVEWGADEGIGKERLEREELGRRVYEWLGITVERPLVSQTYEHQRRWPRGTVSVPVRVGVYRLRSPHKRDTGEAVVENISCGGAYVTGLKVGSGVLPCEPFRVFLEADQGPLKNWRAHCKVVRLQSNGSVSAGLQFVRLSKANLGMIQAIAQP
jgi:CheY-like chemotaxis protein